MLERVCSWYTGAQNGKGTSTLTKLQALSVHRYTGAQNGKGTSTLTKLQALSVQLV